MRLKIQKSVMMALTNQTYNAEGTERRNMLVDKDMSARWRGNLE